MVSFKVSANGKFPYAFGKDILIFDLATFTQVGKIELSKPTYPGASSLRLTATDDPFDDATKVTSVFTAVNPVVHKGPLGLATLNFTTREVNYSPIGPSFPMLGFMVNPDRKIGYSVMLNYAGERRRTEWWVWHLQSHQVDAATLTVAQAGVHKSRYYDGFSDPRSQVTEGHNCSSGPEAISVPCHD